MSRVCQLTGTGPVTGSRIRRSGKAKKKGGKLKVLLTIITLGAIGAITYHFTMGPIV